VAPARTPRPSFGACPVPTYWNPDDSADQAICAGLASAPIGFCRLFSCQFYSIKNSSGGEGAEAVYSDENLALDVRVNGTANGDGIVQQVATDPDVVFKGMRVSNDGGRCLSASGA
jgi:hypothetical protein